MVLLGYHVLFTMVVLPWHFITVICLSLASSTRVGRLSAAAITVSGLLYYLNDFWIWQVFADNYPARALVMVMTLLGGPSLALCLMAIHTWLQTRRARVSQSESPDAVNLDRPTSAPIAGIVTPLGSEVPAA
jgi:hypothetical protein